MTGIDRSNSITMMGITMKKIFLIHTKLQAIIFPLVLMSAFMGCQHGAQRGMESDPIATYDFGQSRKALTSVEAEIRTATPEGLQAIEARMVDILKTKDATYAGKEFACRMLRRIGTEKSIPALEKALYDEQLTDMARFAMQGLPSPKVDKVFRKALKKLDGDCRIGVIGSIAARCDQGAVPILAGWVNSPDKALSVATITALRKIGGMEAEIALSKAK